MKKVLIGISTALLLAAPFAFVSAEKATTTATTTPKRFEIRERIQEKREALEQKREEMKTRFEEKRMELQGKREQKIADILARVTQRFQSALDRLESFADRIEARLALLEDEGLDMDIPQGHVDAARETLDDAQDALNKIDTAEILDEIGTTTPSGPIAELRTQLGAVKELIKKAHGQLVDAISSIKAGLQKDKDDNATSTDEDND